MMLTFYIFIISFFITFNNVNARGTYINEKGETIEYLTDPEKTAIVISGVLFFSIVIFSMVVISLCMERKIPTLYEWMPSLPVREILSFLKYFSKKSNEEDKYDGQSDDEDDFDDEINRDIENCLEYNNYVNKLTIIDNDSATIVSDQSFGISPIQALENSATSKESGADLSTNFPQDETLYMDEIEVKSEFIDYGFNIGDKSVDNSQNNSQDISEINPEDNTESQLEHNNEIQ